MAAAYASLVSLMRTIEQIQSYTRLPISLDVKQMGTLRQKVAFFISFLQTYNSHKKIKSMENRIRDTADAAEDIIETHVVTKITNGQTQTTQVFPCPIVENLMKDMDSIRTELMDIEDAMKPRNTIVDHLPRHVPIGKNAMVGFDDELTCLLKRLNGDQHRRDIIAIVGMGGIGKTTLAKTAYERPITVHRFDICAWVTISQKYSRRQILLGVLFSMKQDRDKDFGSFVERKVEISDRELGQSLYKSLVGMRYLVVMDDMWSTEAWWMVKPFFPDNDLCSRIVVTTRISSVSTHFDSSGLKVNFLSEDEGWVLFSQTVFGKQVCPLELEEVGKKIVRNCKGLPLSIVVVGGLLAKSERTKEYWEYIATDSSSIINLQDDERCMNILSLSYDNLPIHLKPCFLYMGVFPEDREIRVSLLINLWVAEGFLKPDCSKDLEVVGKEYLEELVSRNLLLVHKWGSNGNIKFCNIHDLLRDLCLKEAHKESFMHVLEMHSHDIIQDINIQRRLIIHQSSSMLRYFSDNLNTLCFGSTRSFMCDLHVDFPFQKFGLLRVLKLVTEKYEDRPGCSPEDTFQLVNLRYIAIVPDRLLNCRFPSSLLQLWNVQILIVQKTFGKDSIPPSEIWEMSQLRHLDFGGLYLPDPSVQQMDRRHDAMMKNLQTLMTIINFKCSVAATKKIPNIKKLKILYLKVTGGYEEYFLKNLCLLNTLESLNCYFPIPGLGPSRSNLVSNITFPSSLKKLTLYGCNLHSEDMTKIGLLPHLEVLKMKSDSFEGPDWTVEGKYKRLKFLSVELCDLVIWTAADIHFPCLECLFLGHLDKMVGIPLDIGEIPTLQSIGMEHCSKSAVTSAKEILKEQEELGNMGLQVRVKFWDKSEWEENEQESYISDNFLIQFVYPD